MASHSRISNDRKDADGDSAVLKEEEKAASGNAWQEQLGGGGAPTPSPVHTLAHSTAEKPKTVNNSDQHQTVHHRSWSVSASPTRTNIGCALDAFHFNQV